MPSDTDTQPLYAQMYVYDASYVSEENDGNAAIDTRVGRVFTAGARPSQPEQDRVRGLVEAFYNYICAVNPFVQTYQLAGEYMLNQPASSDMQAVISIKRRSAMPGRQQVAGGVREAFHVNESAAGSHGAPFRSQEVAILLEQQVDAESTDLAVQLKGSGVLDHIPLDHRAYDALYHVLLHPDGAVGWEHDIPLRARTGKAASNTQDGSDEEEYNPNRPATRNMTMKDYYAYRVHWRGGAANASANCLFMGSRLFQEYLCTSFYRVEACRLQHEHFRQMGKRRSKIGALQEFVHTQQDDTDHNVGRGTYLAESFVGGPRDMLNRYQDTVAICGQTNYPSLFVTFTANPKWPEITASLAYGQTAQDRPDLIARVFKAKLDELIKDLTERGIFGRCVAFAYAIEFQSRGLPHAHIVITLAEHARPALDADVDGLVSTEIPQLPAEDDMSPRAKRQRKLRELVLQHMVHNDCSGSKGQHHCISLSSPPTTLQTPHLSRRLSLTSPASLQVSVARVTTRTRWLAEGNFQSRTKKCHLLAARNAAPPRVGAKERNGRLQIKTVEQLTIVGSLGTTRIYYSSTSVILTLRW